MKPRGEIDFVLANDSPEAITQRAIDTGRTRLPVCEAEEGLDEAVGAVNAKDLLPLLFHDDGHFELDKVMRPLGHVSEAVRVDAVLREMRERRQHLALVHDEHGTVVGLLTMEDILEELVGEIEDEFDERQRDDFEEKDGRLLANGQAPMRALADRLGFDLDEHHETTISGYISDRLARVPEPGETVELHGHRIEIVAVEETRISQLSIQPAPRR